MVKLIIFDLDGTLLNTLDDLADCTNHVLQKHGFPTHEVDAYKYFVGNGVDMLVRRALPKETSETVYSEILNEFMNYYETHKEDKTAPYPGITETLEKLQQKGILLSVATNKPHELLPDLMLHYFPTIKWTAVFGNRKEVPVKPNPQIVYDILKNTQLCTKILYVGDTAVDMETAQNAGIPKVGALWGFRTRKELVEANADYLVEKPDELLRLLEND
jgi:phosphoglycolate phosphatase